MKQDRLLPPAAAAAVGCNREQPPTPAPATTQLQVLEVLSHANKRTRALPQLKLPLHELAALYAGAWVGGWWDLGGAKRARLRANHIMIYMLHATGLCSASKCRGCCAHGS